MSKKDLLQDRTYISVCPDCGKERIKNRLAWCEILRGHKTHRCYKCSRLKKGQRNAGAFPKGNIPWNAGTAIWKKSFSEKIRKTEKWKEMRKAVFERDSYTCQECGKIGGMLHPDHILPKATHQDLVFVLDNVRTLCAPCHRKTPTYGLKPKKYAI